MNNHEFHMMQLADSFFPSGTFGLSGGLESFVKSDRVRDARDVLRHIRQQVEFQVLPCDCTVLVAAINAAERGDISGIVIADSQYYSMKLVQEIRTASTRSGRQLLNTLVKMKNCSIATKFKRMTDRGKSPGTYPACLAVASCALGIPKQSAVRMMLYAYCASVAGSAVRMGVISHIEGQKILTGLASDVNSSLPPSGLSDIWQLNPLAEILQMNHEQDELRMFIT